MTVKDLYETAKEIDEIAEGLKRYARCLRGETEDLTGIGLWRMLCRRLEQTMDCKVISSEQYAEFVKLSDREYLRLVEERDTNERLKRK